MSLPEASSAPLRRHGRAASEGFADAVGRLDRLATRLRDGGDATPLAVVTDMLARVARGLLEPADPERFAPALLAYADYLEEQVAAPAEIAEGHRRTLADWLTKAHGGQALPAAAVVALADRLLEDADQTHTAPIQRRTSADPAAAVAGHALNVARVVALTTAGEPDQTQLRRMLVVAALLQDVGMLDVCDSVFAAAPAPDDACRDQLRHHTLKACHVLKALDGFSPRVAQAAAMHHERGDGSGYPYGLSAADLPPEAQVLGLADMYAACRADRPHRRALSGRGAMTTILQAAADGLFPRNLATELLRVGTFPVGSAVTLSDGRSGEVLCNHPPTADLALVSRPVVRLTHDGAGAPLPFAAVLDLANHAALHVASERNALAQAA